MLPDPHTPGASVVSQGGRPDPRRAHRCSSRTEPIASRYLYNIEEDGAFDGPIPEHPPEGAPRRRRFKTVLEIPPFKPKGESRRSVGGTDSLRRQAWTDNTSSASPALGKWAKPSFEG